MRRIMILGPPGSGKSTLARELGARLGLPVFHLDQAFWRPGWVESPRTEFYLEAERLAGLPDWVIDGNFTDAIAPRLAAADMIVYLDAPRWLSILRIAKRIASSYGRVRPDAAPGCPERIDLVFLRYAWAWNRERRARSLATLAAFPRRKAIVRTAADRRRLLEQLG